jgi:hypothetical protein
MFRFRVPIRVYKRNTEIEANYDRDLVKYFNYVHFELLKRLYEQEERKLHPT